MTRYPNARWYPGDVSKHYDVDNACRGIVYHSMEGYIGYALLEVADPNIKLSWPFSVCKDGTVYQHYELETSCLCNGNYYANTNYIGIEHEGVKGEPLTDAQLAASIKLTQWISKVKGFPLVVGNTLLEHNQVVLMEYPNAGYTTCPNSRIPFNKYIEDNVIVTPLDQSKSVEFVLSLVNNVTDIISDSNGCTVLQLETPSIPITPGYKLYGVIVKE